MKNYDYRLTGVGVSGDLAVSGGITATGYNDTNWNTAYGWGNHAVQNYAVTTGDTMTGNLVFNDNVKAVFGTASDGLEIYHDGDGSVIKDSGTGILKYTSSAGGAQPVVFEIENTDDTVSSGSFIQLNLSIRCLFLL